MYLVAGMAELVLKGVPPCGELLVFAQQRLANASCQLKVTLFLHTIKHKEFINKYSMNN
jgi:hypothetical protein